MLKEVESESGPLPGCGGRLADPCLQEALFEFLIIQTR